jgi:hypothetical protein
MAPVAPVAAWPAGAPSPSLQAMPPPDVIDRFAPVTVSQLERGLRELGVQPRATVMVHARMSAFGWIVGGTEALLLALLSVVGEHGTLCAQASWEDLPFELASCRPSTASAPRPGTSRAASRSACGRGRERCAPRTPTRASRPWARERRG